MDRTEIFKFLLYQQFYIQENIITDRKKQVNIYLQGSSQTINKILRPLIELLPLWEKDKKEFVNQLGKELVVNVKSCISNVEDKLGISLFDKNSWSGFNEDQVLSLTCTEFFKMFYERTITKAYQRIAKKNWDVSDRRSKLANEYSLLLNLLYFCELAELVTESITKADKIVQVLLPPFLSFDLDEYESRVNNMKIKD